MPIRSADRMGWRESWGVERHFVGRSQENWREGDVPIKASKPHGTSTSRFELAMFPRWFPRNEGGTGIRTLAGHQPARLPEDLMRAAHGFGWLGLFVGDASCTR